MSTVFFLPPGLLGEVFARKRFWFLELDTIALVCRQWRDEARLCQDARTPVPRAKYRSSLVLVMDAAWNFKKVGSLLQNDREMTLAAVKASGLVLELASLKLQADPTVVLVAVQNCGFALRYASVELQSDRQIVLAAVTSCHHARIYASPELRRDPEVALCFARSQAAFRLQCADLANNLKVAVADCPNI